VRYGPASRRAGGWPLRPLPQNQLEGAQTSEAGLLIRRALEVRAALNLGIHIGLDDVRADEFYAMLTYDDRDLLERERATTGRG